MPNRIPNCQYYTVGDNTDVSYRHRRLPILSHRTGLGQQYRFGVERNGCVAPSVYCFGGARRVAVSPDGARPNSRCLPNDSNILNDDAIFTIIRTLTPDLLLAAPGTLLTARALIWSPAATFVSTEIPILAQFSHYARLKYRIYLLLLDNSHRRAWPGCREWAHRACYRV